jgi:tetratricopeptide (TPR) repeat protein
MSAIIVGNVRRRRRVAHAAGVGIGGLVVLLSATYGLFLTLTAIEPPAGPKTSGRGGAARQVEAYGPRAVIGHSWVSRERGIWEYHLSGEPFEMGYAHSRLGNRLLMETEDYMFSELKRYVPSRLARFLIRASVRFRYRRLPDALTEDQKLELLGLSHGALDLHSDFLPIYHRMLFYHALHDITQTLEHSPLLGCTAFAAAGGATLSGHLFIGRNFDFEGPPIFDRDKAVLFYRPRGKIPFASVAWTGMIGVVTGLSTEGIFVSVNAARSDDKGSEGMPVELLLREVLENSRSLKEAIEILGRHKVLVPDFYLIGDGKTGEAVVVERTPTRLEVRRPKDGLLPLANHGLTKAMTADRKNLRLRDYTTSAARMARLEELLNHHRGSIDARRVLEILRDKRGTGGVPLSLGNRNAIDALITTHSVVADATGLVLWVGAGPHALGRYVPFDLRKELLGEDRPGLLDLPEDPVLHSEEYRAYEQAQQALKAAGILRGLGELDRAIEEASKAEALQPRMPDAQRLLADLLRERGDKLRGDLDRARRHYQLFLEAHPPYRADVEKVREILKKL